MTDRFDNLSVEALITARAEASADLEAVTNALKDRLIASCLFRPGMTYAYRADVEPTYLRSKRFLVAYVHAAAPRFRRESWHVVIQGFLSNARSTTGDGYNLKIHLVHDMTRLVLSSAEPGPRCYYY